MPFELSVFGGELVKKQAVDEVMKCNNLTARFGLVLTEAQARALVETRVVALKRNGRVEFGGGVIDKIINEFCDSPYIAMHNYEATLHELLEIFYYYKNETFDLISDEDLVRYMKKTFDGICQGSLEMLAERELYKLARNLRCGRAPDYSGDDGESDEEDEHVGD